MEAEVQRAWAGVCVVESKSSQLVWVVERSSSELLWQEVESEVQKDGAGFDLILSVVRSNWKASYVAVK